MAGGGVIYGSVGALLGSGSSCPPAFDGSRSMVYFGNGNDNGNSSEGPFYWPHDHQGTVDEELEEIFQQSVRKKRLTAEQVQFLEKNFEVENKLEPERKIKLAKDLGLQARQVAIWFQNRRARWKTKKLEKDYETLKAKYDNLKSSYESLLKEKEKLKSEVLLLTDKPLLKERESNETSKFKSLESHSHTPEVLAENLFSLPKEDSVPPVVIKQEELSSANSVVSDSDSPHYTDGDQCSLLDRAESSTVFYPDQSDIPCSEGKENNLSNTSIPLSHCFLKQENDCTELQNHCGNHGQHLEDQSLWFWQY